MVLRKLMALGGGKPVARHRLPEGRRLYAIGDVHGRLDLLDDLIARIEADDQARGPAQTKLVFLGDLIDRGPDSRGVVERVLGLSEAGRVAAILMGNHEEVMLEALDGDRKAARLFVRIGGRETLLSYGVTEELYAGADLESVRELIGQNVPERHLAFMRSFSDMHCAGDYLFVHAGIRPGVPIESQAVADLRWIRGEFLTHRGFHEHMVIHGHSITEEVDARPNRIGIDTGAYASGRLTAVGLQGTERWFLATSAEPQMAAAPPVAGLRSKALTAGR